jgi:hypothetical protein
MPNHRDAGADALRPARIPLRTPAVAATDGGGRRHGPAASRAGKARKRGSGRKYITIPSAAVIPRRTSAKESTWKFWL